MSAPQGGIGFPFGPRKVYPRSLYDLGQGQVAFAAVRRLR
jgi:hypothetical protein